MNVEEEKEIEKSKKKRDYQRYFYSFRETTKQKLQLQIDRLTIEYYRYRRKKPTN